MRRLWSGAAAAALLAALGACASPHYPIEAGQTPGPAPLSAPRPQYPIDPSAAPSAESAAAPAAAAAPVATPAAAPSPPPASAPVSTVESQPLPPPAGAAPAASPIAAVQSGPAPGPTPVSDAPPAEEPALTPQAVAHDQPGGAAPPSTPPAAAPTPVATPTSAPAPAATPPRVATSNMAPTPGYSISGHVVDAQGIFEPYQVQPGDHIDALARAFSTTRDVLLSANNIRAPYVIRPGQIIKVPVAKAYVAVSGDTLTGVARRFSVNIGELAQLNHVSEHAALTPGEQIGLPSSMRDTGPIRDYSEQAANGGHYTPGVAQAPGGYRITEVQPAAPPPSADHGSYVGSQPASPPTAPAISDTQIAQAARGRFVWPVRGDIIARFGPEGIGRANLGVDIRAASGTPVKAVAAGEVVYAGDQVPGYGNLVMIKHVDGWVTVYAHLADIAVQMKQQVTQGQAVGSVGVTGGATEPELHFEVRYSPTPEDHPKAVDPVLVLPTAG